MIAGRFLFLCFLIASHAATAQDLRLPSSAQLTSESQWVDRGQDIPTGAFEAGSLPSVYLDGNVSQRSWRLDVASLTSAQIMRGLKEQVSNAGFDILFECDGARCGGFDFRFAIEVARPPKMQVNLADFHFLSARRDNLAILILSSKTRDSGFLQITHVGETELTVITDITTSPIVSSLANISDQLDANGHAVLGDLAFERGSSQLGSGPFQTLAELSSYLAQNTKIQIALVGHTDAEGTLEGNIALSKRRAGSVLERLVATYGVSRRQLDAQGMGYLSPIANNQTIEGREANRRVEVVITSISN